MTFVPPTPIAFPESGSARTAPDRKPCHGCSMCRTSLLPDRERARRSIDRNLRCVDDAGPLRLLVRQIGRELLGRSRPCMCAHLCERLLDLVALQRLDHRLADLLPDGE